MRLIILFLLLSLGGQAQIIRAQPFYRPLGGTLLLDLYPNAAAAYSLRKLNSLYTGNCIEVRRSSDNTTSNIGFDSNGNLDTATLKTFVGNNSGFIRTWYDQSGNTVNATQTINANQVRIVNAGIIDRQNSKPTIFFTTTTFLNLPSNSSLFQNIGAASIFTVYRYKTSPTATSFVFYAEAGTTANSRIAICPAISSSNKYQIFGRRNDADAAAIVTGSQNIGTTNYVLNTNLFLWSSSDAYLYINGSLDGSSTTWLTDGNTANTNSPNVRISSNVNGANINMNEFVLYISNQSSNRTSIESNINSYYSIW